MTLTGRRSLLLAAAPWLLGAAMALAGCDGCAQWQQQQMRECIEFCRGAGLVVRRADGVECSCGSALAPAESK